MKKVSIVVPVYNEEDNIEHFATCTAGVMEKTGYDYEIIFVDDGSQDRSREILPRLAGENSHVRYIFLARNYGHQLALTCGLDSAEGDAVITMDGDMQHPPELLPELLSRWEQGYEVVQTIRETTEGVSLLKKATSTYYYRLLNLMTDIIIREGGSDFRLMDRKVVLAFRRYGEHARFIRGMVTSMGFSQCTFSFVAPKRFAGHSKFSPKKMLRLAIDGVMAYSTTPLRVSLYIGLIAAALSLILFCHVIFETLEGDSVPGWATIMVCVLFFGGVQMTVLGVIGEYIGRIFEEVKGRPLYLVARDNLPHAAK